MRERWAEIELSQVLRLNNRKLGSQDSEPNVFAISKYDGVILSSDFFGKRIASKNLDGYKILNPKDWVYSTIHIDEGSIAVNHHPYLGVVSPMYTTMLWHSKDHLPEYFELLLRSPSAIISYGENAQGSINRRRSLSFERFSQLKFLVPSLPEQKRIVDLISSVDSYIEGLQQQLESAKRSRNAVLHDLLNEGGDDWVETTIGEISSFISVRRTPEQLPSSSIYVGLEHLEPNIASINNFDFTSEVSSSLTPFAAGDVLFGRLRPYLHKVVLAEIDGFCSPEILVLRANSKVLPEMLLLYCDADSTIRICVERSAGTRMPRTSTDDLASIEIKLPPITEQERLSVLFSAFGEEISQVFSTLEKARILRSGLLSDLLTGDHEIPTSYDKVMGTA